MSKILRNGNASRARGASDFPLRSSGLNHRIPPSPPEPIFALSGRIEPEYFFEEEFDFMLPRIGRLQRDQERGLAKKLC